MGFGSLSKSNRVSSGNFNIWMGPQEGNILAKHGLIVGRHPSKLLLHETLHCFSKPQKTTTLDIRNSLVNPGLQSHRPSCKDDECVIDEGHNRNRCSLD